MKNSFKSYNSWLQASKLEAPFSFRLSTSENVSETIVNELTRGIKHVYSSPILETTKGYSISLALNPTLPIEGYSIVGDKQKTQIIGGSNQGLLYGVYCFLFSLVEQEGIPAETTISSCPAVPWRMLNHWDNIDGSVERGYAGRSLFFDNNSFSYDAQRMEQYARMLASIGVNAIAINNVNVTPQSAKLISKEFLPQVEELAKIFRPFGIRLVLSVHFDSPMLLGGLKTSDPLDPAVVKWWETQAQEVYRYVPDLAGFLMKADSEFRGGPRAFGRTQADGANTLAKALAPFDGTVFWRCFIYDCSQDWWDTSTDRAKAAFDEFYPLDGTFAENVQLQIKFGPMDFQVREPNSPLLSRLEHTAMTLELQITQEYTGQQIDVYNLAEQWQEVFSEPVDDTRTLKSLFGNAIPCICGVANIGTDENWTGHLLAQQNLFAFGRMAWDPTLTKETIAKQWSVLTFGKNRIITNAIEKILLASRTTYENYVSPLGIGWMVERHFHYAVAIDDYEYSKWGTYHKANREAIGVDRTSKGTGYTQQYHPTVAKLYESTATCPLHFLLFFHRLPYTFLLPSGKTLIQHIYDTHFLGVSQVKEFIELWDSISKDLPEEAYCSVKNRLHRQLENAKHWRDQINTYFYRMSGVPDENERTIYD